MPWMGPAACFTSIQCHGHWKALSRGRRTCMRYWCLAEAFVYIRPSARITFLTQAEVMSWRSAGYARSRRCRLAMYYKDNPCTCMYIVYPDSKICTKWPRQYSGDVNSRLVDAELRTWEWVISYCFTCSHRIFREVARRRVAEKSRQHIRLTIFVLGILTCSICGDLFVI